MKLDKSSWPVLIVSGEFNANSDAGFRLREMAQNLEQIQGCKVIESSTYEDAWEIFLSRADIGCVVIDWDLPQENSSELANPQNLVEKIRHRNRRIPLILLTDRLETAALPLEVLPLIDDCVWLTADTIDFLAGRVEIKLISYIKGVYPAFFGTLMEYSERYKYAWHTPGHMGGEGFLRSPAGVAMYKFYGENTLRSDLSISVPELGSLLDHSGVTGDAEKNSARVFGADQTYYVLNGTSTVNQIIWNSQVTRDDLALVDRNCHKSLNYAMVTSEALPVYMIPRRNRRGIIGPVRLSEFSDAAIAAKVKSSTIIPETAKDHPIRMSALTNSTYDGICYNVLKIKETVSARIENLHFDEAWYAYAHFHPIYSDFYGMAPDVVAGKHPPIFCSQSTHKLLTAFSQASMLHIKNGDTVKIDPAQFNESYMMHGSTSPQYSMIASLDVATKMMADNGEIMFDDIIGEAVEIRKKVASIGRSLAQQDDWFFGMWQPRKVELNHKWFDFEDVDTRYLASTQKPWIFNAQNNWHGFDDIEDNYIMLDPIKLTVTTPGLNDDGTMPEWGIPAAVVTNFLIDYNIVCEKTDYYSFLLLNSLGTTRGKQGALLAGLFQFKEHFDNNTPLAEVMPEMVRQYPEVYTGVGLKDHCNALHNFIRRHDMLNKMQDAFEVIPDQAMCPAEAYRQVVRGNVEFVELDQILNRIPAVMLVPYPPGIPIMMGGEIFNDKAKPIYQYLKLRQEFENTFPGYESDIHGVERLERNGKKFFKTLCLKQK